MSKILTQIKEYFYFISVKLPNIIIGKLKGNLVYTHWGRGLNNFGDCLSPAILKHYGFTPVYSQIIKSDIILAGTILQGIPRDYAGIIMGSGADNVRLNFPKAKILGVRGSLTLKNLDNSTADIILGDPGLIMNKVFPEQVRKKYKLGIVPHFVDKNHSIIKQWQSKFGKDCIIIDVMKAPKIVINEIKNCYLILSSSLHGLIIADAFNIPNARFVIRETMPIYFYDYKFDDYYSSLKSKTLTIEATGTETFEEIQSKMRSHKEQVTKLQEKIDETFRQLKNYIKR